MSTIPKTAYKLRLPPSRQIALPSDDSPAVHLSRALLAMSRRLEPILGDHWTGAFVELKRRFPTDCEAIDEAEARLDTVAIATFDGAASVEALDEAVEHYEAALAKAARALAEVLKPLPERRPCDACGDPQAIVMLGLAEGGAVCSRCFRSGRQGPSAP